MMVALLALRLRDRGALVAADRAALPRGRRVPGDHRQPGARSRDDRALPRPPRAGAGRAVRRGAGAVRARPGWCASGWSRSTARKVHANASEHATRDYEQIAREILEEAAEIDARRGRAVRRARAATSCRRSCRPREGRRGGCARPSGGSMQRRAEQARPIPRVARQAAEGGASRRLEEELEVERAANADYEAYRARGVMKDGRRFGAPPKPYQPPDDAGGQDQPHRSRLAQRQDAARLGAGLQRPGRRAPRSRS